MRRAAANADIPTYEMKKPFDVFLDQLDSAADEHIDGRKYSPRRDVIKNELSDLIHEVGTDAGQQFTDTLEEYMENGFMPDAGRIQWESYQIRDEHSVPAGDSGKYSLYRDD